MMSPVVEWNRRHAAGWAVPARLGARSAPAPQFGSLGNMAHSPCSFGKPSLDFPLYADWRGVRSGRVAHRLIFGPTTVTTDLKNQGRRLAFPTVGHRMKHVWSSFRRETVTNGWLR